MSIKFSELTAATSVGANDIFPFVPSGGASAKKVTFSTLKAAIAPAKVYRASLTQGGDLSGEYGAYSFIVGHRYVLAQWGGDDFTNIGFVENNVPFVATGTTPNHWDGDSQNIFDLTLNAVIWENTLGINPSFVWNDVGFFKIPEMVDDGKTILRIGRVIDMNGGVPFVDFYFDANNSNIATFLTGVLSIDPESGILSVTNSDGMHKSTAIEILRYP